jgi:hypothetical protein
MFKVSNRIRNFSFSFIRMVDSFEFYHKVQKLDFSLCLLLGLSNDVSIFFLFLWGIYCTMLQVILESQLAACPGIRDK